MEFIIFVLGFVLLFLILILVLVTIIARNKTKQLKKIDKLKNEDRLIAIDELRKEIKRDPDNSKIREKLADFLMDNNSFLPAIKEYLILVDQSASNPDISEIKCLGKIANCYLKLGNYEESKKYFLLVKKKDDLNLDANLNLGVIDIKAGNFDKALVYLNLAVKIDPENQSVLKNFGICALNQNKYKDAYDALLKSSQIQQDDNELTFNFGFACFYLGKYDEAIRNFSRLFNDPQYSTESMINIAAIYMKQKSFMKAAEQYELILQKTGIKEAKLVDLYYNLSECYLNLHNVSKALVYLNKISMIRPDYKDVQVKLEKYSQMNNNSMLEKYLIGSVNQFTNLAKLFAKYFLQSNGKMKGNMKFINLQMKQDNSLEMMVEITSGNFVEQIYFIFMRSSSVVGDLIMRNIYNHLKEQKIDRAVCITAGSFSETAKQFVESRMIELVEKQRLMDILASIQKMLAKNVSNPG